MQQHLLSRNASLNQPNRPNCDAIGITQHRRVQERIAEHLFDSERAYAAFVKNERFKQTIDLLDTPAQPKLTIVK